jgi:glycosyltransferase involved in cell wall biosynthesis
MRVLLLCRHSFEKTAGGVVEYLHYLPTALKAYGIETVMYDMGNETDNALQGPHLLPNGMPSYSGPLIKPGFLVSRRKLQPLIDLCRSEKIDLVHAQGTYRSGFVALQLFKRIGLPYVVMSHGDIAAANSDRMKRGKVQRRCSEILRQAVGVSHLTPMMADASHAIFDTRDKSVVIANGIDLASWDDGLAVPEQNYVLGIGRLQREKGFHVLIDAYAWLQKQGVKTSLVIAGDGAEALNLHAQVLRLGLKLVTNYTDMSAIPESSVVFTGYVKGDAKHALIAGSQLILFPTQPSEWEEPFGIVQIEAMAAGKVLVASDSATTRYLQSLGLQARLAKADDAKAWAEQMLQLLGAPDVRKKLGSINLDNVKQFDWDVIAKQYRDMYLRCLPLSAGSK